MRHDIEPWPGLDEWLVDAELVLALAEDDRRRREAMMQFYQLGVEKVQ